MILLVIGIFLLFINFYLSRYKTSSNNLIYQVQRDTNYKVNLKPNNFYSEETLLKSEYYVSNAIESININFKYLVDSKNSFIESYKYNIKAKVVATIKDNFNEDKEIWEKENILKEDIINESKVKKLSIIENIDLPYPSYISLVESYEKYYGIIVNATLKVYLNVIYTIDTQDNVKEQTDSLELNIPLTSLITNIEENYEKETNNKIILDNKTSNNNIYYIIGIILIIISILLVIIPFSKFKNKNIFNNYINHLLKEYKGLIIKVNQLPPLDNLKYIYVENIEYLIDIANQNSLNIIYYEKIKNKQGNFYIFLNDYIYLYEFNINKK